MMTDQVFQILHSSGQVATVERTLFLQPALSNLPGSPEYKPWDTGTVTASVIELVF